MNKVQKKMEEQAQSLKKKQEQCTQLENSLKECKDKIMASEQQVEQLENLHKVSSPDIFKYIFIYIYFNLGYCCLDISLLFESHRNWSHRLAS